MKYVFIHTMKYNVLFNILLIGLLAGCVSSPRYITMQVLRSAPANFKGGIIDSLAIVLPYKALNDNNENTPAPSELIYSDTLLKSFTLSCLEGFRNSTRYSSAVIKTYKGAPLEVLHGFDMVLYTDTLLYRINRNLHELSSGNILARIDLYAEIKLSVYDERGILTDRHSFKDSLQWYGEGSSSESAIALLPAWPDMFWDMGLSLASR